MANPIIIQGGMGVAVSGWRLARAVSLTGQLGVVSGTALPLVLARQLQLGDPGGHLARAAAAFPQPSVAARVWRDYFMPGGKPAAAPFKPIPMPTLRPAPGFEDLAVLAAFCEVYLAKEGHEGAIGMNLLEKIQLPTLPTLYGALLAGVDYILMGAGIPRAIPGLLDRLARGEAAQLRVDVAGALPGEEFHTCFDPSAFLGGTAPSLRRPAFLAIVSSATLALTLARKSSGRVDGFIVEGPAAGGHNAPPRGPLVLSAQGEPVYGPRDEPELPKIRALGLPFWLAGSYARPDRLAAARAQGATGVQLGTAFALCEESGIAAALRQDVLARGHAGALKIHTDPKASPTGFPFKVADIAGTVGVDTVYQNRVRICDLGYLREPYRRADGTVGYRCGGEPVADFMRKGGAEAETVGRKCLCNGLMATVGLGQVRQDGSEPALVTVGDDAAHPARFLPDGRTSYRAADLIRWLLAPTAA